MDILELLVDAHMELAESHVRFVSYLLWSLDMLLHSIPYIPSGFDTIVLSAYTWLSENYREGDRIFLFGAKFEPILQLVL